MSPHEKVNALLTYTVMFVLLTVVYIQFVIILIKLKKVLSV